MSISFKPILMTAVMSVGIAASPALAATVNMYSDDPQGTLRATLDCNTCSVLLYTTDGTDTGGVAGTNNIELSAGGGSYGTSQVDGTTTDFGELFTNPFGSNPKAEADWFNSIFGTSVTLTDSNKTEPASDGTTYTSSAGFVIVKVGTTPNYTIIKNENSGGSFQFTWTGAQKGGAGISHFTEVAPVPLPAAGFLLITALGGLGIAARRRRKSS